MLFNLYNIPLLIVGVVCLFKGELSQLNGLGLADNPLTSPPPHVVREGTNAVLSYLRDQLRVGKEEEEKDEEGGVGAKAESGKEIVSGGGRGVLGDPNTESGKCGVI